eukprot:SAG11_NODE_22039_length_413_cov_1.117834_1_plen_42_part_10
MAGLSQKQCAILRCSRFAAVLTCAVHASCMVYIFDRFAMRKC